MSYYQKYRPKTFEGIKGQEQTIAILKAQARTKNFGHSYLMFGPSGTGKTSTARVLAASLNCPVMNGTGEPCGQCPSCRAISEGRHYDVLEVDGARFRGIEEIKELAYKSQFAPWGGGKKVYIIDECHALSKDAFNGLLKLLEEPPAHLVLILCTTHFEQIPDVVTSRCQLYPFKKLASNDIKAELSKVAHSEGFEPTEAHLGFIAETACGNMRASLNVLEQICVAEAKHG